MKNENYYTVQGWMRNELGLCGNELMCYAIIYGFCQDEESKFLGTTKYLSEWIGCTRETTAKILKTLADKNLIIKTQQEKTNVCAYSVNHQELKKLTRGVKNLHTESEKSSHSPCEEISQPLIYNNNKYINNTILSSKPDDFDKRVADLWNGIAEKYKLAKVSMITPARHKALLARLKEHNIATPEELFDKIRQAIKESMLLKGKELVETSYGPEIRNKSWRPSFDFFICQPSSLLKTLEGAYADPDLVSR